MKKIILGLSIATVSLFASDCILKDGGVGIKVGTLGLGLEYAAKVNDKLDVRLGVSKYTNSSTGNESDIKYDIDLNLQTIAAIADYHVFGNGFVLSAGLIYNGNNLDFDAQLASGDHDIGDNTYSADEIGSLKGEVTFNKIAPYIGMGYSNVTRSAGWGFSTELGALYQGEAKVDLSTTGTLATLLADVENEEKELESDLGDAKWYPVISLAVSYKF